jgi:hypothetical protein
VLQALSNPSWQGAACNQEVLSIVTASPTTLHRKSGLRMCCSHVPKDDGANGPCHKAHKEPAAAASSAARQAALLPCGVPTVVVIPKCTSLVQAAKAFPCTAQVCSAHGVCCGHSCSIMQFMCPAPSYAVAVQWRAAVLPCPCCNTAFLLCRVN